MGRFVIAAAVVSGHVLNVLVELILDGHGRGLGLVVCEGDLIGDLIANLQSAAGFLALRGFLGLHRIVRHGVLDRLHGLFRIVADLDARAFAVGDLASAAVGDQRAVLYLHFQRHESARSAGGFLKLPGDGVAVLVIAVAFAGCDKRHVHVELVDDHDISLVKLIVLIADFVLQHVAGLHRAKIRRAFVRGRFLLLRLFHVEVGQGGDGAFGLAVHLVALGQLDLGPGVFDLPFTGVLGQVRHGGGPFVALVQGLDMTGFFAVGEQDHRQLSRTDAVLVLCVLPDLLHGRFGCLVDLRRVGEGGGEIVRRAFGCGLGFIAFRHNLGPGVLGALAAHEGVQAVHGHGPVVPGVQGMSAQNLTVLVQVHGDELRHADDNAGALRPDLLDGGLHGLIGQGVGEGGGVGLLVILGFALELIAVHTFLSPGIGDAFQHGHFRLGRPVALGAQCEFCLRRAVGQGDLEGLRTDVELVVLVVPDLLHGQLDLRIGDVEFRNVGLFAGLVADGGQGLPLVRLLVAHNGDGEGIMHRLVPYRVDVGDVRERQVILVGAQSAILNIGELQRRLTGRGQRHGQLIGLALRALGHGRRLVFTD